MREQDYITPYDRTLLRGRGFTAGFFDSCMWGVDGDGNKWQAVEDEEYFKFGKMLPNNTVTSRITMTREKFDELFSQSNH